MTGASIAARSSACGEQRDDVERLDRLADPLGDLGRRDALGEQLARAPVARLRRQRGGDEVARAGEADHRLRPRALALGEAPDLGEDVPRRGARGVEALRLGRAGGQRRGVLRRARELDADRVARLLADDARAHEDAGDRRARAARRSTAATSPAPSVTISRACAGPPTHGDAVGAERGASSTRRRGAVGRHEPLGERDDRRAAAAARPPAARAITSSSPREGTPRNT